MRCITLQHIEVYNTLLINGVYRASYDFVSENLIRPYKFMQRQLGFESTPIFLSPVSFYVEMGGAKTTGELMAMEFDVPSEYINIQRYYDWSDLIYFMEIPWEFEDAANVTRFDSVEDWGKTILNINKQITKECKDPLQVTVPFLKREWLVYKTRDIDKLVDEHYDTGGRKRLNRLNTYD